MKRTSGFTVVEIIIAVIVVAILATIAVFAYGAMRARAMDAKLEQEAAQLSRHIDAMIAKRGSTQEVLHEVIRGSGDAAAIREYLNLRDFRHIKIKALMCSYGWYDHIQAHTFGGHVCIDGKSDDNDCGGSYKIKDKVMIKIMDDYGSPWGGTCGYDTGMSIIYNSHVTGAEKVYREYKYTR